ncbi:class II aldolase/adducin family protein [Aneurinibacillus tyrosinisolvens]|uniref:class II aldolase/adducin family protein n=1 Tax=Aneurinibacillus tyrosinisolvens TaxID=1443435 RepID=UPI00063FA675|nr:class II aldolase/adducin family protein [Aneurinibacillus tyrosinisolvens]
MDKRKLAEEIAEVGRRIYRSGFVAANDGNISARINDAHVIITPSGVSELSIPVPLWIKRSASGEKHYK